jgi:hypothetical protein
MTNATKIQSGHRHIRSAISGITIALVVGVVGGALLVRGLASPGASGSQPNKVSNTVSAPISAPTGVVSTPAALPTGSIVQPVQIGRVKLLVPGAWHRYKVAAEPQAIAYLNVADDPMANGRCCTLPDNAFFLTVTLLDRPDFDVQAAPMPTGSTEQMVGGYLVVEEPMAVEPNTSGYDTHLYFLVGQPGLGHLHLEISAVFKGPNVTPLEAQVRAFVRSLSIAPDPSAS